MSTRSWLAKAKSVHDLGGHFYLPKAGETWEDARGARADDKWLERSRRSLPAAVEKPDYFGSRMHDSWVLGVRRSDAALRVTLDRDWTDAFAGSLASVLGVEPVDARWPVDLVLHEPTYVRAARYDPRGALRYADPCGFAAEERQGGDQFLYDWFFEEGGRLQWVADLWAYREPRQRLSTSVYLMVDCARASAEDRCADALATAYGPPAGRLYGDAVGGGAGERIDFNVWDVALTEAYLRRRIAAHGLTRADFRDQRRVEEAGRPL